MKKKATQKQPQQTVLSRFFQVAPPKKPSSNEDEKKDVPVKKEIEAPKKPEEEEEEEEARHEEPTQQTQEQKQPKTPKKNAVSPPPKKRLRKIIDDDDSGDESDEIFDDSISDEDYSSGDNEASYSSDENYESDDVSEDEEEDNRHANFSGSEDDLDDILSDEDTKPKRKPNNKKKVLIEDFENKSNDDSRCMEDEGNANNDDEDGCGPRNFSDDDLDSLTTQPLGLNRFSNDSTEEVEFNEKRHKAFVNKLRRIQSEKDAKNTRANGTPKYTPMEQQVVEMKKRYPDCILAFEVGYKFSLYGRDAEIANEVLKVYCYQDHNFLTAMIPTVRLNFHLRRLVQAGYKVGLVRQTEVAAIKALSNTKNKPFTRKLTDLYTPATLVGSDLEAVETDLSSSRNYMGVDLSTGDVVYDSFKDDGVRSMLDTTLTHLSPRELLIPKGSDNLTPETSSVVRHAGDNGAMVTEYDVEEFEYTRSLGILEDFYGTDWAALATRVTEVGSVAVCLGALIAHLRRFSLERGLRAAVSFRRFADAAHMQLSGVTIRNLELLRNSADGGERGSLLWVVGQTSTPFGRRLLARWLTAPLLDAAQIEGRLDAVEELGPGGSPCAEALSGALRGIPDLERGLSHIQHRRCGPKEFVALMDAFVRVTEVVVALRAGGASISSELLRGILDGMPGEELCASLNEMLGEIDRGAAESEDGKGKLFLHLEHFPDVQKRTSDVAEVERELDMHLESVGRQLGGRRKLKYTHMAKEEYLIELGAKERVPKEWIKVTATSSVTRWRTPAIAEALARLQCARALLTAVTDAAWLEFLGKAAAAHYAELRALVCRLAELDCLLTFARLAATRPGYVRPRILRGEGEEAAVVRIVEGRNPVAEALLGTQYVPNSVELAGAGVRCSVLTGPNMGGKTSLLRQVALTAVLAQAGCFVPAEAVELTPLDAIYTRMGAADCIEKGQSTYFVELAETAPILRSATPRSLVILDELGRGTSTHDGMAIAYAALWHLIRKARCLTLFVTHYTTLAQAVQAVFPKVAQNLHMAYMEGDGGGGGDDGGDGDGPQQKITFLYKVAEGISPSSFGLNVARIAGFPSAIIDEAVVASKSLERVTSAKVAMGKSTSLRHFADLCECLGIPVPLDIGTDDNRSSAGSADASQEMSPEDRLREIWFSVNLLNQTK